MKPKLYKPNLNARMNRELINIRMRIACKEKRTHVHLYSYNNMHMHCFSDFFTDVLETLQLEGLFSF